MQMLSLLKYRDCSEHYVDQYIKQYIVAIA